MFQGNWTCSACGGSITELPFEPRRLDGLKCRPCMGGGSGGSRNGGGERREKRMYDGNWTCSGCNKTITQLPFMPRDASSVKCSDCFRAK